MDQMKMDDLVNDALVDDVLEHYGIKGMKWGIRRKDGPDGTVSSNPAVETSTPTKGNPGGSSKGSSKDPVRDLSDQELRDLVNRLQMEKQLKSLMQEDTRKADGFIKGLLKDAGKRQVRTLANLAADIAVEQALAKYGDKSGKANVKELGERLAKKNKKSK
jgi:hypothetical protein